MMTNEEMDKLDRLAAMEVMGWKLSEYKQRYFIGEGETYKYLGRPDSWQPTRNIAQAWMLLDKLSIGYEICTFQFGIEARLFRIDSSEEYSTEAETAPLAITLACLKARGIQV